MWLAVDDLDDALEVVAALRWTSENASCCAASCRSHDLLQPFDGPRRTGKPFTLRGAGPSACS